MQINGYTIKSVKTVKTENEKFFTGSVYFKDEKIAQVENFGEIAVHILIDYDIHRPVLTEEFVRRLFALADYEKLFRNNIKIRKYCGIAIVTYANRSSEIACLSISPTVTIEQVRMLIGKERPRYIIEKIEIFRSLKDFNITI